MSHRVGKSTVFFDKPISFLGWACVGGKKEGEGPFGDCYDYIDTDDLFGQESFERAESAMQGLALQNALERCNLNGGDISVMFGGDLLNQCIGTSFGIKDFEIPFLGIYGACSTISEGILLSSVMVDSGAADKAVAVTSSHFCSAERQYRFPLDYGGQRTPTSQWTATASGAVILNSSNKAPFVRAVTIGTVEDMGVCDANNMGAAMAPAAYSTIKRFLSDANKSPNDFDCIVTGDLGNVGSRILCELLHRDGIEIKDKHFDCGCMLFDQKEQDVHAGGSGCGCAASLLCGHFLPQLASGKLRNILFAATGALLSTTSSQQGMSIPSISHLAWLTNEQLI